MGQIHFNLVVSLPTYYKYCFLYTLLTKVSFPQHATLKNRVFLVYYYYYPVEM